MRYERLVFVFCLSILSIGLTSFSKKETNIEDQILTYKVDCKTQDIKFFWKNEQGEIYKSIQNLKSEVETKKSKLVFAMNGGMYKQDNSPLGLFIQNKKTESPINNGKGSGNFYLNPNGIFYITTENVPFIVKTGEFVNSNKIKYATQSGPMLVLDGNIHSVFKEGSANLNIRNGVGILPNNQLIFAMSKSEINFYDFAKFFQNLGCKNALYLDGFVSKTYLPEKNWIQLDGNFGVIIGVTEKLRNLRS
jgi:uncharacterized protein YigE (DUF2233 family)